MGEPRSAYETVNDLKRMTDTIAKVIREMDGEQEDVMTALTVVLAATMRRYYPADESFNAGTEVVRRGLLKFRDLPVYD